MNEFELIKTYFQPLSEIAFDDDAAVLSVPEGYELVVSSDTINEGVHYRADAQPGYIARKALRSNLSDLAAMGARPFYYQLNLALPGTVEKDWLEAFTGALAEDQQEFDIRLSGGDSTAALAGASSISITIMGLVEKGKAVRRGGAKAGDLILLSGPVGEAVAREYHHMPYPRLDLVAAMEKYAHGAIDISDGLPADLGHMAAASGLAARVELADIPLYEDTDLPPEILLTGGEDYELLIAVPPEHADKFAGCSVIGEFAAGQGVEILDRAGDPLVLKQTGWSHF